MTDPVIIEAAMNALPSFWHPDDKLGAARSVVGAVTPLIEAAYVRSRATIHVAAIRNAALEEAAVIIENDDGYSSSTAELAAAIRALKEQP